MNESALPQTPKLYLIDIVWYHVLNVASFCIYYSTTDWGGSYQVMAFVFSIIMDIVFAVPLQLLLRLVYPALLRLSVSTKTLLIALWLLSFCINELGYFSLRDERVVLWGLFDGPDTAAMFHGENILISTCSAASGFLVFIVFHIKDFIRMKSE